MSSVVFSLLDTPAYGGAEEYLLLALMELKKAGHRVVLATNNALVRKKADEQLEVIDLPYRLDAIGNWKGLIKYFFALPGAIIWLTLTILEFNQKHQDIVCLFPGYTDRLSFSPVVKLLHCRLIWLEYGPLEPTFKRNHGFPKLLYALGRPYPDRVITISEWTKRSLVRLGKIPEKNIQIIYPGIVIPAKAGIQSKNKHPRIVVTIARLATEKEMDLLLRAWKKVNQEHKQLVVIGDGPERHTLERLADSLGIAGSVTFTGFVTDERKHELLRKADVFVFPSAWNLEGFGMTSAEAMVFGTPVLSTGFGPQAEIVKDGVTGWTFTPHDEEDLARKINDILGSSDTERVRKAGLAFARKQFSFAQFSSAWVQLLQS
jgi:glycosyltransferase involved in cell wall biosynthesis